MFKKLLKYVHDVVWRHPIYATNIWRILNKKNHQEYIHSCLPYIQVFSPNENQKLLLLLLAVDCTFIIQDVPENVITSHEHADEKDLK